MKLSGGVCRGAAAVCKGGFDGVSHPVCLLPLLKRKPGPSSVRLAWLCAGDGWNVERVCGILLFIAYFFLNLIYPEHLSEPVGSIQLHDFKQLPSVLLYVCTLTAIASFSYKMRCFSTDSDV